MTTLMAQPEERLELDELNEELLPAAGVRSFVPQRRYVNETSPWRLADVVRCGLVVAVGGVGAIICWYGMSRENTYDDQTGWLFGAVGSAILFGIGMALWLIFGLRTVRRGQRELWADMRTVWDLPLIELGPRVATSPSPSPAGTITEPALPTDVDVVPILVTGVGMTKVHAPECLLVADRPLEKVTAASATQRGLERCGVCLS